MARSAKEISKRRAAARRKQKRQDRIAILILIGIVLVIAIIVGSFLGGREKKNLKNQETGKTTAYTLSPDMTKPTDANETKKNGEAIVTEESPKQSEKTKQGNSPTATSAPQENAPSVSHTGTPYVQKTVSDWKYVLANDWNPLSQSYVASIPLANYNSTWQFDERALPYLNKMLDDANADGCGLWGQSLFRDYDLQKTLYERQVQELIDSGYDREKAETEAATIVKRPGTSEHNTGLAVDFECEEYTYLDEGFEKTKAFDWLKAHCAEYGFILRFPKDKESVTGVIYEPWHYRYVGESAAKEIMSRGICLEEYLEEKGL